MTTTTRGGPGDDDRASRRDDPRVQHFLDLLDAIENADARAGIIATRELRRLGLSVVLITPSGQGGRR